MAIKLRRVGLVIGAAVLAGVVLRAGFANESQSVEREISDSVSGSQESVQEKETLDIVERGGISEAPNEREMSSEWELERADRTGKMEAWLKANGRWDAYETFRKKYTSPDWVRSQFPAYGPDSLELARRMMVQQTALMAATYTPYEVERLRGKGIDIDRYFVMKNDPGTTESLMAWAEVVVVMHPLFSESNKLHDGFQANGVYVVTESLKGLRRKGDTLRVRQLGPSLRVTGPVLAYLTRSGGIEYTTGISAHPVALPENSYYERAMLRVNGEEIIISSFITKAHKRSLEEVRQIARLYL